MFDEIRDGGLAILWLPGSAIAGFAGAIAAIYWCRRDE